MPARDGAIPGARDGGAPSRTDAQRDAPRDAPAQPDGGSGGADSGGVWRPISADRAPAARMSAVTVWTGAQVCVWGGGGPLGQLQTGAFYDPRRDVWQPLPTAGAPTGRNLAAGAWLEGQLAVWGGFDSLGNVVPDGARFNPLSGPSGDWLPLPGGGPSRRLSPASVDTGSALILSGGLDGNTVLADGAALRLGAAPAWSPIARLDSTSEARFEHTAVWTGSEMIVWGGQNQTPTATRTGAVYDPRTSLWRPISVQNAPLARTVHTAVWTGSEMIVWGGQNVGGDALDSGGAYSLAGNSWRALRDEGSPEPRTYTRAVWTGSEMIVWGGGVGRPLTTFFDTGGRYRPDVDRWTPMTRVGAPSARAEASVIWAGSELVVWGGLGPHGFLADGARWRPD